MYKRLIIGVTGIVACLLLPLGCIQWRLYKNERAKQPLLDAVRRQFPDVTFRGAVSYEAPRVYIGAFEVRDQAAQAAIKEWLANAKELLRLDVQIRLIFCDEKTWDEWAVFEF
jgi:hypothetical protein